VNNTNSQSATKQVLRLAVKKAGLTMKYESTGRYMINTHSFRAYGITKLSRLDVNFAKKIAGQKGYLLQYDRLTDEEKLDLYEKFESELTIDDNAKQKAEIEQFQNEKSELQKFKNDMELKSKFQNDEATRHLEKQGELYKMILDLKREVGELKKSKK